MIRSRVRWCVAVRLETEVQRRRRVFRMKGGVLSYRSVSLALRSVVGVQFGAERQAAQRVLYRGAGVLRHVHYL